MLHLITCLHFASDTACLELASVFTLKLILNSKMQPFFERFSFISNSFAQEYRDLQNFCIYKIQIFQKLVFSLCKIMELFMLRMCYIILERKQAEKCF